MGDDGNVALTITAKNLTVEAFNAVSAAIKKIDDDSERMTTKGKSSWGSWFATITGGVALGGLLGDAFRAAGSVLSGIPGQLIALGERGADVNDVENAFRSLNERIGETADVSLAKMRSAFGGTVSDFDLMKGANEGLQRGLKLTGDDLATLAKGARITADAVGGNAKDQWNALITAIATGKERTLKGLPLNFAAISKSVEDHARSLGTDVSKLSEHEKAIAMRNAVLQESKRLIQENGEVENDFGDNVKAGKVFIDNWTDSLGQAIAKSPALSAGLSSIATSMTSAFGGDKQAQIKTITGYVDSAAIAAGKFGIMMIDGATGVRIAWDAISVVVLGTLAGLTAGMTGFLRGTEEVAKVASFLSPFDQNLKNTARSISETRLEFESMTTSLWNDTKAAGSNVVALGDNYTGLVKLKTGLTESVAAMALAATQTAATDEKTKAHANTLRTDYGPAVTGADEKTLKLKQSLGELNQEITSAYNRGIESGEVIRLFGSKALTAADDAKRAGLTIGEAMAMVAAGATAAENSKFFQKIAAEQKAASDKIYEDLVARKAKEQDVEFASIATLLAANKQYRDDLTTLAKTGTDRQIAEIERGRTAELSALEHTTGAFGAIYDERRAQINAHYDYELRLATGTYDTIAERMRDLGVVTRRELDQSAGAASRDYRQMLDSGLYTADQLEAAWVQMMQANAAALGGWRGGLLNMLAEMPGRFSDTFGQILTGQVGFRDGMKSIGQGIRDDFAQILSDMLRQFLEGFLAKMLSSLLGARPGFASAFSGLLALPGGGGGLPGMGGLPGVGGLLGGGGGAVMSGVPISGIGGSVGALPGGAAAVPWWSTALGGGAIGGAAGGVAGWMVGSQTGNKWGGAGAGIGAGATVGMILGGPIGAGIGALIGAAAGFIGAKVANKRANNNRDDFLQEFGQENGGYVTGAGEGTTYNKLAGQLQEMGRSDLFENFRKANDPKELAQAIEALLPVLDAYKNKTKSAAQAEEDLANKIQTTKAESEAKMESLRADMKSLDDQLAQIDASEAVEEVMGSIEKKQRAQIAQQKATVQAAMDAQQQATEQAIKALTDAAAAAAAANAQTATTQGGVAGAGIAQGFREGFDQSQTSADGFSKYLDDTFGDRHYRVYFDPEMGEVPGAPSAPPVPGHKAGGVFSKPHLAWFAEGGRPEIAGDEAFMARALAGAIKQVGVPTGGTSIDYDAIAAAFLSALHRSGLTALASGNGQRDALDRVIPTYLPDAVSRFGGMRSGMRNAMGVS